MPCILRILFFSTILALSVGCLTLNKDPYPAAIGCYPQTNCTSNNYLSLETKLFKNSLGINGAYFQAGNQTPVMDLEVYPPGDGELIFSGCSMDETILYEGWPVIKIPLNHILGDDLDEGDSCVLTITAVFTYEGQERTSVRVYPMVARVAFGVGASGPIDFGSDSPGYDQVQLRDGSGYEVAFGEVGAQGKYFIACGDQGEEHELNGITLHEISADGVDSSCVFFFAVNTGTMKTGNVFMSVFRDEYTHLPPPKIEHKGGKVEIKAATEVSFIRVGASKPINNNHAVVKAETCTKITTFTVKGRSSLSSCQ